MLSAPLCMVGSEKRRSSDSGNQVTNFTIRMKTEGRSEFVFSPALFSDFFLKARSRQNSFSSPKRELATSGQGVLFFVDFTTVMFRCCAIHTGANKKKPRVPSFVARTLPEQCRIVEQHSSRPHFRARKCFRHSSVPHFRALHFF